MISRQLFDQLSASLLSGMDVALITVTKHPHADKVAGKTLLWPDGRFFHDDGYPESFLQKLIDQCRPVLARLKSKTIHFEWESAEIECFVDVFSAPPKLVVAGAGHVSEPAAQLAKMLGFYVTVIDDREMFANITRFPYADEVVCESYLNFFRRAEITPRTYILLITRGHQFDVISLRELLKRKERAAYIGMIGSRRRISGVFEQLRDDFPDEWFDNIYTPVGLDIGAQTPAEIAVSIMAEILKVKNGGSGRQLSEDVRDFAKLGFKKGKGLGKGEKERGKKQKGERMG